jgi:hypothetical protein
MKWVIFMPKKKISPKTQHIKETTRKPKGAFKKAPHSPK